MPNELLSLIIRLLKNARDIFMRLYGRSIEKAKVWHKTGIQNHFGLYRHLKFFASLNPLNLFPFWL